MAANQYACGEFAIAERLKNMSNKVNFGFLFKR